MPTPPIPASFFGMVLGTAGIGQAWRLAAKLWGAPAAIGESILLIATLIWLVLLVCYLIHAIRQPALLAKEFQHPVQGSTPALIAIATLLIVLAILPYSRLLAWILAAAGLTWHLGFALWYTGTLWQGGRDAQDMAPTLYLPTVGANFTAAAALGALGHADWGWLFLGAGIFSWLALESLIFQRIWQTYVLPPAQRPLLGIQFAPASVCAMAWQLLNPGSTEPWLLMLWGYGLFQLILAVRLKSWLGEQAFAPSYWAYTFGIAAATVVGLRLALAGVPAAQIIALPLFVSANLFIGYLVLRTLHLLFSGKLFPKF